ncbi:hypothetical protein B566_EDAN005335 [Ephemera danica]|nr:hypothetical protein B566_EDAN005335 [Ephemera danica]
MSSKSRQHSLLYYKDIFAIMSKTWVHFCIKQISFVIKSIKRAPLAAEELINAIHMDDKWKVELLLTKYSTVDLLCKWVGNLYFATPLEFACKEASIQVMNIILNTLGNENLILLGEIAPGSSFAPFHYTAYNGNVPLLQLIINKEVIDVNLKTKNNQTALHLASLLGHEEVVKLLLNDSQTETDPIDYAGETPLHVAACNGHLSIVKLLLSHGANINTKSQYGMTPLLGAACKGKIDVVLELVEHGADPTVHDSDSDTALHFLRRKCSTLVLKKLLQGGALLGASNKLGITPLHGLNPKTLQQVLNESISFENIPENEKAMHKYMKDDRILKFINPFVSNHNKNDCTDLKNFKAISQSKKHEHLVFHPIFKALIVRVFEIVFRWRFNRHSPTHWFEMFILVCTLIFLVYLHELAIMSAMLLVLTWGHAFLHVSRNFIKFMLFSLLLLIGFLLAFHFVLRGTEYDGQPWAFDTIPSTALKMASMTLGELTYEEFLKYPQKYSTWAPLLTLFIFFICFVLLNMMNGLAVSDTQDLRKRAEFATTVAHGDMILSVEAQIIDVWWAPIFKKSLLFMVPKISEFTVLPSTVDSASVVAEMATQSPVIVELNELQNMLNNLQQRISNHSALSQDIFSCSLHNEAQPNIFNMPSIGRDRLEVLEDFTVSSFHIQFNVLHIGINPTNKSSYREMPYRKTLFFGNTCPRTRINPVRHSCQAVSMWLLTVSSCIIICWLCIIIRPSGGPPVAPPPPPMSMAT